LTLVARERLHSALDQAAQLPLTVLVAPAGTGKTVLLSDWASRRRRANRDIFWVPGQEPAVLDQIINGIEATGPVESFGTVVVDDAHLLPKPTLDRLARVLSDDPGAVRLLMASRYDLPLPVAELELRGLGSTLRSRDLSFNDEEAAELVRIYAEDASAEDVSRLQRRTAGWAAALVLAARALAVSGELIVTEQPVLDALLGETFGTLDPRVQNMLLSTFGTAIVTGRLGSVLSGDSEAPTILADLAGRGLLVTAYMDDSGGEPQYRYHPLLVELLRRRVLASPEAARLVVAAHRRAALYHENRGEIERALRNAVGADDPALVARVLLSHGPVVLAGGDAELVAEGFEALPDDYVDTHPQLVGLRGLLRRMGGDVRGAIMDAASAADAVASAGTAKAGHDMDALEADMHLLQLWQSRYGWYDVHEATEQARAFLGRGNGHHAVLGPERLSWLLIELAAAETWADDLDNALSHLDEALVTARMAGHPQLIAGGLAHRAVIHYARGQVENAARAAQSALDVGGACLADDYAVRAQVILGLAALNHLEMDEARRRLQAVTTVDVTAADTVVTALRAMLRAVDIIEDGRLAEARMELASDPVAAGPLPSFLARDLALLRFWVAVLVGDRADAEAQMEVLDRMDGSDGDLVRAIGSIVDNDAQTALKAIDAALAKPVHPVLAASATSVRTVLLLRIDDQRAAEEALIDTLNRVAPQRVLYAVTAAGRERNFMDLLRRNATGPSAHPFAAVVLDKLSDYHAGWSTAGGVTLLDRARPDAAVAPPRRLDAIVNGARIKLTAREADVLDQLALGSAYGEIAQTLFITENTVKTHLMALYRKLGVDKRSAALRVARTVGLIRPPSPGTGEAPA
jgi:ATP/maltotriose-dependent transcriptional regulator MalT